METQNELKWYQKPSGVIILLIFFFPVGLYLMWKNEMWTKQTRWIISGLIALSVFLSARNDQTSACDCIDILSLPTEQVGIGMPLPIEHLSNEDFRKYKKCYEKFAGPATATLKCAGK